MSKEQVKIVSPTGRIVFHKNLFKATEKGQYKASLLFDKNQKGVKEFYNALREVALAKFDEKTINSKKFKWGLKTPDEDAIEKYEFLTEDTKILDANTTYEIEVKGPNKLSSGKYEDLIEDDIKAGDYCRFVVSPAAYEFTEDGMTSRGAKFYLSAVQKIKDGEALYQRVPSDDIFAEASFDIEPEESEATGESETESSDGDW